MNVFILIGAILLYLVLPTFLGILAICVPFPVSVNIMVGNGRFTRVQC